MNLVNYIGMVVAITTMGILFKRYQRKYEFDPELKDNDLVKKFLLNDQIIYGKPNLWIYNKYEKNSRKWNNFYSRSNFNVNKPYIQACLETIVKYNGDDFNIFIVNDESFSKLLDDWNIVLSNVTEPIKEKVRKMGMCKLLYKYGGMYIPRSFLSTCQLKNIYTDGIRHKKMFCAETLNKSTSQLDNEYIASNRIMGCMKFCDKMGDYIKYLHNLVKNDYTKESCIIGQENKWLQLEYEKYSINVVNGRLIGIKDIKNEVIGVEDLLGESILSFDKNKYGIYIDEEEITSRTKYNWFDMLSKEEIFKSNTVLGDQMLLSHGN
jgi:hypothetical protein